jgi:hypothetical protein
MRKVFIWVVLLVIFPCLLPSVHANDDSVKILLFVSDPEDDYSYNIGETVPVNVRVFDKGELTDADTNPKIVLNPFSSNNREINLIKTGLGNYNGSFTITKSDVDDDYLNIKAEATLGKENETDFVYDKDSEQDGIMVSDEGRLGLEFVFDYADSSYISATPGDTIYITVNVENNSIKINPDSFNLTADDDDVIEYTNPLIGVFKANYTVSSILNESTYINIKAEAEYDNDTTNEEGQIRVNFWNIWFHRVGINNTQAQFELCVADVKGKAVSGADIKFNYEIDGFDIDFNSPSKSGTTDSQGKAFFSIDHESASYIYLRGSVEFSGKTQDIYCSIPFGSEGMDSIEMVPKPHRKFQVIYQKNIDKIETGETVTLDFMAYEGTNPIPDQLIYFYLSTDEEFIKSGSTTTDSMAKFTINLTVPEASYSIHAAFEAPFEKEYSWEHSDCDDDLVYRQYSDFISVYRESEAREPDISILIEIDALIIGGKTTVKASRSNSEDYEAYMMFLVGNYTLVDIEMGLWLDWEQLTSVDTYPSSYYYPKLMDGKFIWEFHPEEFLSLNETYTIIVMFLDPIKPYERLYWNDIQIKPYVGAIDENGEQNDHSQSPINMGSIGIYWLAIIVVIIIIIAVLVPPLRRRKIRTKPSKSNQSMPSSNEMPSQQVNELSFPPKDPKT